MNDENLLSFGLISERAESLLLKFLERNKVNLINQGCKREHAMPTSLLGDEDGPSGPSVDSDIQAERIQARRERIAARQLAENG